MFVIRKAFVVRGTFVRVFFVYGEVVIRRGFVVHRGFVGRMFIDVVIGYPLWGVRGVIIE